MAEEIPAALLSKLAPEMNLNQLKKILKVPSLDSLSQQLSLLNPEEIFKSTGFNANINDLFSEITNFENNLGLYLPINDFLPQLPSPQILEQTIQSVTQGFDINGQLQGIVQSYLETIFKYRIFHQVKWILVKFFPTHFPVLEILIQTLLILPNSK